MNVPLELKPIIEKSLKQIINHPNHEFGPERRRQFVEFWMSLESDRKQLAYRFLDVITAEHVIHIYEANPGSGWVKNWYYMEMPKRITQLAKATLTEEIPDSVSRNTASLLHTTIGAMNDFLPVNSELSLSAAHKALWACASNISPVDDFDSLNRIHQMDPSRVLDKAIKIHDEPDNLTEDEKFTDAAWVRQGSSDVVATAAIASSCTVESYIPQPNKLINFWIWWMQDAIPRAWKMI